MRRSLLLPAALLGGLLGHASLHAQPFNNTTQFPPAPNAASGAPQPANSLPSGGATGATLAPGAQINSTAVPASAPGVNTLHPLHPPRRAVTRRPIRHRTVRHPSSSSSDASPARVPAFAARTGLV